MMALGCERWGLLPVGDIVWYSTGLAPVFLDLSSLLFSVPNVGGLRRLAALKEVKGDPSRTIWGRRSVSTRVCPRDDPGGISGFGTG